MGITFLCPVHRDHRLGVQFLNPVDGGAPMEVSDSTRYLWKREGETFDTLTLGPSVDASEHHRVVGAGHVESPCWHGFITDGEIR